MTGHTFLFNSFVHKAKELTTDERFGTPVYFHATRTNFGPFRQDVNAYWDLAPHDISILLFCFPELRPRWVSCVATCVGTGALTAPHLEDIGLLTIGFDDTGFIGHVHCSWLIPGRER
eukprot:EC685472.1.p1 GENE.EC685472.1~~EC685472.1.p1  ORF type:complete len:118 (+),score=39.43 EC685472.1:63-416(+)